MITDSVPCTSKATAIKRGGFIALLLIVCADTLAADKFVIDSLHSIPQFEFSHLGVTTQTGRFDKVKGTILIDFAHQKGSVTYEVQTASLNMGYGTETPDSAGYQLFMVTKFPTMRFKSNKLLFDSDNQIVGAEGTFTMLGVTRPMTLDVNNFRCATNPMNKAYTCAGQIRAKLVRSQFGMVKYLPGISDEITITVPIEAYRQSK